MKAIVHVGLPKTGTTSIQGWLSENVKALCAAGIAYDPMNMPGLPKVASQLEIGFCQFERCGELIPDVDTRANYHLDQPGRQAELAKRYEKIFGAAVDRARKANCHTFALSSEHVGAWCRKPYHVSALDDWLSGFFHQRQYVIYLRSQEDWLASLYSQHIKNGGSKTMQEFVRMYGNTGFLQKTRVFIKGVGRTNLTVRLMEQDTMRDGDLYSDFANLFGLDAKNFLRPSAKNPSLSMQAAEFLRIMNGYFPPRVDGNRRRNPLFQMVPEFLETVSKNGRKLALNAGQIAKVRKLNANQNETLRAEFFPDRAELFTSKPANPDEVQIGARATASELGQIGIELYRETRMGCIPPLSDHDKQSVEHARLGQVGRVPRHESNTKIKEKE